MSSSPRAGPSTEYPNNAYDQHNESPESPASDQDAQDSVIRLLENLSKCGKGQYYCPYGAGCRKGGLHRDGTPAVFERNSTFKLVRQLSTQTEPKTNMHRNRTHLQKHLKVYKCDIPVAGISQDSLDQTNLQDIRKLFNISLSFLKLNI